MSKPNSTVRNNMLESKSYSPYCCNCNTMARTVWNGNQMECKVCEWQSAFPVEFINEYKEKHNL